MALELAGSRFLPQRPASPPGSPPGKDRAPSMTARRDAQNRRSAHLRPTHPGQGLDNYCLIPKPSELVFDTEEWSTETISIKEIDMPKETSPQAPQRRTICRNTTPRMGQMCWSVRQVCSWGPHGGPSTSFPWIRADENALPSSWHDIKDFSRLKISQLHNSC